MTFFCPACWKEIQRADKICPCCNAHLPEYENKHFEEKLINALRHPEQETVQRAVYLLGKRKSALEKELREPAKEILGKLTSCWSILEEAKARKLKKYGVVASVLEDVLDPYLNGIIDLMFDIERLLLETPR